MPTKTAVVILNWNTRKFLEQFLPEVIKHSEEIAEIIVADNASTDDSVDFLKKEFPRVRVIVNSKNEGFTGGYNASLAQVEADYYVILNSDVMVTPNWLSPLVSFMDAHPEAGACQPKVLSYHAPEFFEYAGAAGGYIDLYGYPFCRGRIFHTLEKDLHQYDDTREVFWATGACMVVRSSIFHQLNGFDPNFFAHMEEIDICWRMQLLGYKIYYCGDSAVFHVGGGTLPKSHPKKTFLNFRNNLLMLYKNADPEKVGGILTLRIFLDFLASVKFLFSGSFKEFSAVWKAYADFHRLKKSYPSPKARSAKESPRSLIQIFPKSIVRYYYLSGRKTFSSLGWKKP